MSQGIALLEEALTVARKEKMALEDGAYEQAIELAEKRGKLTGMAWNLFEHDNADTYRACLMELSGIQSQLTSLAKRAQDTVRNKLCRSRLEKKRLRGYQAAVGQALQ